MNKLRMLCFFCFSLLPLQHLYIEENRHTDPSWLPPPVGITGPAETLETADTETSSSGRQEKLSGKEVYTTVSKLHELINERLAQTFVYPERARQRGVEGDVGLLLGISCAGQLISCIQEGDAPPLLARAAVQQLYSVFPLPVTLERPVEGFSVHIIYRLQ